MKPGEMKVAALLLSFLSSGCLGSAGSGGGSSGSAPAFSPSPAPDVSTAVTLTVKSGFEFSCFAIEVDGTGRIYCRKTGGGSPNPNLGIPSSSYTLFAEAAQGFDRLEVWDDTICAQGQVATRPYSRTPGTATYCWGEASLGANNAIYPLIYGGPVYSTAAHGSPDFDSHATWEPFVGSDSNMTLFTNEGGMWLVMMDGWNATSTASLSCTISNDETTLTCPGFTLGL